MAPRNRGGFFPHGLRSKSLGQDLRIKSSSHLSQGIVVRIGRWKFYNFRDNLKFRLCSDRQRYTLSNDLKMGLKGRREHFETEWYISRYRDQIMRKKEFEKSDIDYGRR